MKPRGFLYSGNVNCCTSFVTGSSCWPNDEVVPRKSGGRSFHSYVHESVGSLRYWSELTPSKKLSRNRVSLSSNSEGPEARGGGEGSGYCEFDVSISSESTLGTDRITL